MSDGIKTLVGVVLTDCFQKGDREVVFKTTDKRFRLGHRQDCCEVVRVEEIHGDLLDLVGSEILYAEEASCGFEDSERCEEEVWTFYKIRTMQGSVTIRFCGSSNGYYSVKANFIEGEEEEEDWEEAI
jgi:hypothetical protein